MSINEIMATLVAELTADEIPAPLAERFTLAHVWSDLARLAGETPPAAVLVLVGESLDAICEPLPLRPGAYAAPARQFALAD